MKLSKLFAATSLAAAAFMVLAPAVHARELKLAVGFPQGTAAYAGLEAFGKALKEKRTNDSPWLGLSVLSFDEKRRKMNDNTAFETLQKPANGLFIDDVYDPSPAATAGIRPGDIILSISDTKIVSVVDFQQALYYFSGTKVPVRFFREGKEFMKIMAIEKRPTAANRK
jgi:predicted metalloprotease with PDZ domain